MEVEAGSTRNGRSGIPASGLNHFSLSTLPSTILDSGSSQEYPPGVVFASSPQTRRQQYTGLSRSDSRITAVHKLERAITTIHLLSRTPSQFTNTGVETEGSVTTDNSPLVVGSEKSGLGCSQTGLDGVFGKSLNGTSHNNSV